MVRMRREVLDVGAGLFLFGDDASLGEPISEKLKVALEELAENGVELFSTSDDVSSNRLELKFGRPQLQQYQLVSLLFRVSYIRELIFMQSVWNHSSQLLHATECMVLDHLQAFPHIWQGNLGARGPGFG
ncbi:MAG: hypothetical protein N0E48_08740 [Candidatus Thiodiazotropha endolucinida]|nr:hypothetical protein [Candidatus Thiodiazotropha taylori]MCW4343433.1 hypothetical protein [Candidatus Thiodiazotropha endolucinida]